MYIPKQFLGAFKRGHRKPSRNFIDESLSYELLERVLKSGYEDREAIEALAYLTRFNNEFHKNVIKKGDPEALHDSDERRRQCYARENARNRDLMSIGTWSEMSVQVASYYKSQNLILDLNEPHPQDEDGL